MAPPWLKAQLTPSQVALAAAAALLVWWLLPRRSSEGFEPVSSRELVFASAGRPVAKLSCPNADETIAVTQAVYGSSAASWVDKMAEVARMCNGRNACSVSATAFGALPSGDKPGVKGTYTCGGGQSVPPPASATVAPGGTAAPLASAAPLR